MLKIFSTDTIIQKCAKQAAMICEYSISNPLHCAFEDGNIYEGITMRNERVWNEIYHNDNGDKMYNFINDFIDNFLSLNCEEKYECYRLFRKKWQYLQRKEIKQRDCSFWRHYLGDDGNIYVQPFGRAPYVVF